MFKNILILSPHPDDEVLSCGGLISWAKRKKKKVFVKYFAHILFGVYECRQSDGKSWSESHRSQEMLRAATEGGFEYEDSDFQRFDFLMKKDLISEIERLIKQVEPDTVCVPSPFSCNQDHRIIYESAHTAVRPLPSESRHFVSNFMEYEEPYGWYMGENFKPNLYLSLEKRDIEKKKKLIKSHKSQVRSEPYYRSIENIIRIAELRGRESGQEYAEAYKIHRMVI
jgi:LmbE family N-acetylglucosaminyl deacetylase